MEEFFQHAYDFVVSIKDFFVGIYDFFAAIYDFFSNFSFYMSVYGYWICVFAALGGLLFKYCGFKTAKITIGAIVTYALIVAIF